jgi:hypothetical protein
MSDTVLRRLPHTSETGLRSLLMSLGVLLLLGSLHLVIVRLTAADSSTDLQWVTINLPSLPPIALHKAVIVDTESGEFLCAIGGDSPDAHCYRVGPSGVPYSNADEPAFSLPRDLRFHAATVVDDRIYILGGYSKSTDTTRDEVYCVQYDGRSGWTQTLVGQLPKKIFQHASVTIGSRIYAFSGTAPGKCGPVGS